MSEHGFEKYHNFIQHFFLATKLKSVGFTPTCAIKPIATNVVNSNPDQGDVYSIQLYVIKFISDLRHFDDFLRVLRSHPQNKNDPHDIAEILFKVKLNNITLNIKLLHLPCNQADTRKTTSVFDAHCYKMFHNIRTNC